MNRFLLLTLLLLTGAWVFGQTPSADCATGAGREVVVNGTCATSNWNDNTNTPANANCDGAGPRDKWIWFRAIAPSTTITFTHATALNAKIYIYNSGAALDCGTMVYNTCVNDNGAGGNETITIATTINDYYFVRVTGSANNLNGTLCVTSVIAAPANDECATATVLAAPSGVCTPTAGTSLGGTNSGVATTCGSGADDDVWFSVTVAAAGNYVFSVDGAANYDAVVEVFSGPCAGPLTSLGCSNVTGNDGVENLNINLPSAGTYRVRVFHNGVGYSTTPTFNICVVTPPINDNCLGAINLPMNGFCAPTAGTSLNASLSLAGCTGDADDDVWYSFVANGTGIAQVSLTGSASYNAVLQVFSGTCAGLSAISGCINATGNGGTETVSVSGLVNGTTYYVRVYNNGSGSGSSTFSLCVQDNVPCVIGGTIEATLGGAAVTYTTVGQGNDLTSANVTNFCGSASYLNGSDIVYTFTPLTSGQVTITLTNASSFTSIGVYDGCPIAGGSCIGSSQSASGSKTLTICVTAGVTYYTIIDSWPAPTDHAGTISFSAVTGGGASANDLPCNYVQLALGVPAAGNNTCAGSSGEPGFVPACWSTGTVNTVWYRVQVPASGQLRIRTVPSSSGTPLQNTQIAVYSGTCGPGLVQVGCNDNMAACGTYTQYNSDLTLTGLTPFAQYFVSVDGNQNSVGAFEIIAIDGATSFAPVPGQDCTPALPVCNATMTTGNPGFQAIGAGCDFTGAGNCTSGEANSVWYGFTMLADGDILFNIVPNDYGSPTNPITGQANPGYTGPGSETDYDWVLWKVSGAGSTTCAAITSSGGDGEIACNFSFLGVTGTSTTGNAATAGYPAGFDAAYEVAPFGVGGDQYLLVIQNYSASTSGFTIQFGATPVNYAIATDYYWSGGAGNSDWSNSINWGGCGTPLCARNAFILAASVYQPVLTNVVPTTYNVQNLTINSGATLTINSGVTLNVCGNFTNNGNLVCQPGSTVIFNGTGTQTLSGSFVGADAFHHFVVNKTSGTVVFNNDVTINGDFTTSNATSIVNSNNRYVRIGGNFSNFNGNSTFTNTGTLGTLHFIGTGIQNYNQGASQLDLNIVYLQNTGAIGSGVILLTDMFVKTTTGTLVFLSGTITTNAFRVHILNTATFGSTNGNATSFVDGNLRRHLLGTGAYPWAIGNVAKGFQRGIITFASNTNTYIDGRFDVWPGGAGYPPIQGGTGCSATFSLAAMDNGYWTFEASPNSAATYNMSLFPTNVTNAAAGWTIMKRPTIGPMPGWILDGTCVASTVTQINRNDMSGFSVFGIAQSPTPLPIELSNFSGEIVGEDNLLTWTTVSEQNNDYFTLERSRNGIDFEHLATVQGAGTSTTTLNYSRFDYNPFAGISYYRLKQTDFDGQYTYSQIIALNREMVQAVVSDLFPNPANQSVNFDLSTPESGIVTVEMYDNAGRLIMTNDYDAHVGSNNYNIDISELARGVYATVIRFEHLEKTEIKQLIKY